MVSIYTKWYCKFIRPIRYILHLLQYLWCLFKWFRHGRLTYNDIPIVVYPSFMYKLLNKQLCYTNELYTHSIYISCDDRYLILTNRVPDLSKFRDTIPLYLESMYIELNYTKDHDNREQIFDFRIPFTLLERVTADQFAIHQFGCTKFLIWLSCRVTDTCGMIFPDRFYRERFNEAKKKCEHRKHVV